MDDGLTATVRFSDIWETLQGHTIDQRGFRQTLSCAVMIADSGYTMAVILWNYSPERLKLRQGDGRWQLVQCYSGGTFLHMSWIDWCCVPRSASTSIFPEIYLSGLDGKSLMELIIEWTSLKRGQSDELLMPMFGLLGIHWQHEVLRTVHLHCALLHSVLCTTDDELVQRSVVQRTLETSGATGWTDGGVSSMADIHWHCWYRMLNCTIILTDN